MKKRKQRKGSMSFEAFSTIVGAVVEAITGTRGVIEISKHEKVFRFDVLYGRITTASGHPLGVFRVLGFWHPSVVVVLRTPKGVRRTEFSIPEVPEVPSVKASEVLKA